VNWYQNPIKRNGDFADPFVLRYNGKYYLYCTNPDIRCWSSYNLVDWQAEGPAIAPGTFPGLVPFAPEVVYWNGRFYMYTSPSGHGHYVLASENPIGPFEKITGNVGHNIDGSVLIDDDGQWYFYWADDQGILGCRMDSPTQFGQAVSTGAYMHGWTEGPFVMKRGGKYHMTYTGNHYLSRGYRINAAVSDDPLCGYTDNERNPIIIHTEGKGVGLGHSSTVLGPDLHTYYIVYHNINPDASRDLNIDAIVLDDAGMYVYGPTRDRQPAPQMPAFWDSFDTERTQLNWELLRGTWQPADGFYSCAAAPFACLWRGEMRAAGAIECHLKADETGGTDYGILLGSADALYKIALNPEQNVVRLIGPTGQCVSEARLPGGFVHSALHCLRIRYDGAGAMLFIDGRRQLDMPPVVVTGGRFGYFSDGVPMSMGFTAYNPGTETEAKDALYMPVPGYVPLRSRDAIVQRIHVPRTGEYALAITGDVPPGSGWDVKVNDTAQKVQATEGYNAMVLTMTLPQGLHRLEVTPPEAAGRLAGMDIFETCPVVESQREFAQLGPYQKEYIGEDGMGDYIVEAQMRAEPCSEEGAAGVMFRVTEPSEGGEGDDRKLGINFFIGYCVSWKKGCLILSKHRYDEVELARKEIGALRGFRVEAVADQITVYLDGDQAPVISYRDASPIFHGRTGIRVRDCMVHHAMIRVAPLQDSSGAGL